MAKKIFAIVIALNLSFVLYSCGKNKTSNNSDLKNKIKSETIEVVAVDGMPYAISKDNKSRVLVNGSFIEEGETVVIPENAKLAFKNSHTDLIVADEKTQLKVLENSNEKVIVDLYKGKIDCSVDRRLGKSKFEVKTPVSTAGVRGTKFSVDVTEK